MPQPGWLSHANRRKTASFGVIPFPCEIPGLDLLPIVASQRNMRGHYTTPLMRKGWRDTNRVSGNDENR